MLSFIEIGRLLKSFGKEGKIRYHVEDNYFDDFARSQFVFVDIDGSIVPFQMVANDEAAGMLLFDGITSPQEAEDLTGKNIYLSTNEIAEDKREAAKLDLSFQNYALHNEEGTFIAKVDKVEDYPSQKMLVLTTGQLIPLHKDLVVHIDEVQKVIHYKLPEGLLDVNM